MMTDHKPHILWDWGTAYDLFASLHVLHHPEKFGLRGSWAAGVRSRLAPAQRTVLEQAQELFFSSPLAWVSTLPQPRDAATALYVLSQIPPAERLLTLAFHADEAPEIFDVLKGVKEQRKWTDADLERLKAYHHAAGGAIKQDFLVSSLDWWSRSEEFGEAYLSALQAYVSVFFAEEERRIRPHLEQALAKAQELALKLDFTELFVELSRGVKMTAIEGADEVKLVPSYWSTPLVMYDSLMAKHWVVLFGARPVDMSLVPGELVPDAMLLSLKALSDPTRLLILRYLSDRPQTPSQLARQLRLRAPTVIHHLSALRLAGLVYVSMDENEEKCYTVRQPAVKDAFEALHKFLLINGDELI